jgi:hypothetical protein
MADGRRPTTQGQFRSAVSPQERTPSTTFLKQPLPAKYFHRAAKAFANFSLSKFPKKRSEHARQEHKAGSVDSTPSNYVPHPKIKDPAAVQAVHRKIMTHQLSALQKANTLNQGMTLTVPKATIKELLPSYNEKKGTVNLSEMLNLMRQKMKGTEFYTRGNPTLNRLTLQSQVDQIIKSVTEKAKK